MSEETAEEIGINLSADELIPFATLRDQFVLRDGAYLDNEILEAFIVRRDMILRELLRFRGAAYRTERRAPN